MLTTVLIKLRMKITLLGYKKFQEKKKSGYYSQTLGQCKDDLHQ